MRIMHPMVALIRLWGLLLRAWIWCRYLPRLVICAVMYAICAAEEAYWARKARAISRRVIGDT